MMRRSIEMLLALLILAGLALALRQDLADLALSQGQARLRAGDLGGAAAAFARAAALGRDAAPLAYNLGVSLYRKGEYLRARDQFSAALATAGPELAAAIRYNRGNSQFRQGERLAGSDREAARAFFREAVADYGKALSLEPGAVDAGANLGLARERLAALGSEPARAGSRRDAGAERPGKSEAGSGKGQRAETTQAQPATGQAAASRARAAARTDAVASPGKTRRDLTRQEAERLLNEARGREKPAGMPHGDHAGQSAKPDRDW
jgi:tetratricopeptide (TPR) repeat protein